jgi:hypothetical protein
MNAITTVTTYLLEFAKSSSTLMAGISLGISLWLLFGLMRHLFSLWLSRVRLPSTVPDVEEDEDYRGRFESVDKLPEKTLGQLAVKNLMRYWLYPGPQPPLWECVACAQRDTLARVYEARFQGFEEWLNGVLPTAFLATVIGLIGVLPTIENRGEFAGLMASKLFSTAIGFFVYVVGLVVVKWVRNRAVQCVSSVLGSKVQQRWLEPLGETSPSLNRMPL